MTAPIREPGKEEQAVPDAPEQRAMRRSAARLAAVQALYQIEITNGVTAAVVDEFRAHRQGGVLEDALAKAIREWCEKNKLPERKKKEEDKAGGGGGKKKRKKGADGGAAMVDEDEHND